MQAVETCWTTAGWQTGGELCRGSVLGASMLLPQRLGCDSRVERSGGVGSMISIEEEDCTTHGLLEGLAGGWGGVILTVGGINCLRPPWSVCCENFALAVKLSVFTVPLDRLKGVTAHVEVSWVGRVVGTQTLVVGGTSPVP